MFLILIILLFVFFIMLLFFNGASCKKMPSRLIDKRRVFNDKQDGKEEVFDK